MVSSPRGVVRSRRKPLGDPVPPCTVAVSGADSGGGPRLLTSLARAHPGPVLALAPPGERHRGEAGEGSAAPTAGHTSGGDAPDTLRWVAADVASPTVVDLLRDVDVLVHVAARTDLGTALAERPAERRARAVRTIQTLSTAAAAAGVAHLVVVTSAMTYGGHAGNALPLAEDAPLAAEPDESLVGDLLAVEDVLTTARRVHPGLTVTSVRPAALVGPGVDTATTRHFAAPRLLAVKGGNPAWQFCHVDDLATAMAAVVAGRLGPVVTVGCAGWLSQRRVEQLSGMRRVELSANAAHAVALRLHRIGVLPAPATDLAFVTHPWAIGSATARAAGWRPAYDNEACLGVLLEGVKGHHAPTARRLDRKEAALGAASAAVALAGTAAIMRRRRRKGGGA